MERSHYHTKQKQLLLDIIQEFSCEFTVKELYQRTNGVGLTTIYRYVESLEKEGKIKKMINNGIVTYQYLEKCEKDNHFYLKCNHCGFMIHIDCDCINELSQHIENKHSFQINKEQLIIPGICKKCREKVNYD